MSMRHLGPSFDIHTGGVDLIFPHHEDEIAQSEAATGQPFVRTWLHCAHLQMGGAKMAKSTGNIARVAELLEAGVDPRALRYALIAVHYRAALNYTRRLAGRGAAAVERLDALLRRARRLPRGPARRSDAARAAREAARGVRAPRSTTTSTSPRRWRRVRPGPRAQPADRRRSLSTADAARALERCATSTRCSACCPTRMADARAGAAALLDERAAARAPRGLGRLGPAARRAGGAGSPSRTRATDSAGGGSSRSAVADGPPADDDRRPGARDGGVRHRATDRRSGGRPGRGGDRAIARPAGHRRAVRAAIGGPGVPRRARPTTAAGPRGTTGRRWRATARTAGRARPAASGRAPGPAADRAAERWTSGRRADTRLGRTAAAGPSRRASGRGPRPRRPADGRAPRPRPPDGPTARRPPGHRRAPAAAAVAGPRRRRPDRGHRVPTPGVEPIRGAAAPWRRTADPPRAAGPPSGTARGRRRPRPPLGRRLPPPPRPGTCWPRTRSSSPAGARSRRRSSPVGRAAACSSSPSAGRPSSSSCSTRRACGSRSSRSRAAR